MSDDGITIRCPCGRAYDAPRVPIVRCPFCGRVWDLLNPEGRRHDEANAVMGVPSHLERLAVPDDAR